MHNKFYQQRQNISAFYLVVFFTACFSNPRPAGNSMKIVLSLPRTVGAWQVKMPDERFTRKNLYDYIDGGAQLYLSYDFREMAHRTYTAKEKPDIDVDIYDMGSCAEAFGVFSLNREREDSLFGRGSQYNPGMLHFFKSRFYISIVSFPPSALSKKAIFDLADHIESSISDTCKLPQILSFLPRPGLRYQSIRYFHSHMQLHRHLFVANKDILHVDSSKAAILAEYNKASQKIPLVIVLVEFSDREKTVKSLESFIHHYSSPKKTKKCFKTKKQGWICCASIENIVCAVFESSDKKTAEKERASIRSSIKKYIQFNR